MAHYSQLASQQLTIVHTSHKNRCGCDSGRDWGWGGFDCGWDGCDCGCDWGWDGCDWGVGAA